MAESTLNLKFATIVEEVAAFLGVSLDIERQKARVESFVKSGLRQFYFPKADGNGNSYDWSFLKPVYRTTLLQNENILALPDDFGGFEGEIVVALESGSFWPVKLVGIGRVELDNARLPVTLGYPLEACLEPLKGTTINRSQRFQLKFFPVADQDYTLIFQYYILPECLDGTHPYAYGGAAHAETILESCLMIAEQRDDDAMAVHTRAFNERLMASIAYDRKFKPQNLGKNLDRSVGYGWQNPGLYRFYNTILVNGQVPGGP